MLQTRKRKTRPGLTLMELVVVMFILMALAAIMVPLFPSLIERAHRSSQGTNATEIAKAVQLYQSFYGNYPDGYDLLTDGTAIINYFPAVPTPQPMLFGETAGTMAGGNVVNASWIYPAGGYVNAGALTTNALNALNGAGIVNEYPLLNGATLAGGAAVNAANPATNAPLNFTPTFNPYPSGVTTPTPLSTSTQVVYVYPTGAQVAGIVNPSVINPKSRTQFILFGVGKYCATIGTTMSTPGNNFPNDSVHENPNVVYQRFGVVYQVEDAFGNGLPSALFLGCVAIESNILAGPDTVQSSYYQNIPAISAPAAGPGE